MTKLPDYEKRLEYFRINMEYARNKRKMTRTALASAIGVTIGYIGLIERGSRKPSVDIMFKISDYFELSIDDMFSKDLSREEA